MTPDHDQTRFAIVGAGLGGALLANYLGRAGYTVDVYERRSDPRTGHVDRGRSINLAISVRGIHALDELGLADRIMPMAIPMRGRMIHSAYGDLSFQPYDKDPAKCINSISRAGLNLALIEAAAEYDNVRFHFERQCVGIDLDQPAVILETPLHGPESPAGGTHEVAADCDIVLAADGAFSAVRGTMQHLDRFNYEQSYLEHGYKELSIPPTPAGEFALDPNALHIWPRRSFMMIALPNPDRSFTCTLFLAIDGPVSFTALQSDDDVRRFFEQYFRDAVPLMPTQLDDFRRNPTGSLATVRCGPWHYRDKVLLLGDAAHAIVPFYGQGMNCAFEDCTVLNDSLRQHAPDWDKTFREFYHARKPNTDTIADLALHNFIEMRDHTGSTYFRFKKAAERIMDRLVPGYTPLYSMISFSRIPYAQALDRARHQHRAAVAILVLLLAVLIAAIGFI